MNGVSFAMLALVPMVCGPLTGESKTLTAQLCGGGEINIPIGDDDPAPRSNCHQMACHAGTCRQKAKRAD